MVMFCEFKGHSDNGVVYFGRVWLENGAIRAEGSFLNRLILNRVRDLRPFENQEWVDSRKEPERFLKILPYYYCGCRLHCSTHYLEIEGGIYESLRC